MDTWTVWVGGSEVNDHYLTESKAQSLAQEYLEQGYEDVQIEKIAIGEKKEVN